ncbi:MAG: 5'-3' exonuclease H3TH domain-containing protein [Candidatus Gracilibacteria bacterium]|jgi:DNA polymerase-1
MVKKFVIIDGNALIHRCYHAVPQTLRAPSGELTNAVFGFTGILLGILEYEHPDYLAVAWDMKGPTFRDALFADYKGTRAKTDDELIGQFPRVRQVLDALSVPCFEKEGLEADDYLGIVTTELRKKHPDIEVLIVTADKDALQLVGEGITVVAPVSGYTKVIRYDREAVRAKMGVWPEQVPDFKGLSGDTSDNIPGVPGIGEKTAVKLLEQWGSVEGIYENIEKVEPVRIRELMRAHEAEAHLCKKLATIIREDGITVDLHAAKVHNLAVEKVRTLFAELGFRGHLGRVEKLNKDWEKLRAGETQTSLF